MQRVFRQLQRFIYLTVFALGAVGVTAAKAQMPDLPTARAAGAAIFTAATDAHIPRSVLDPNFRQWQPPQPVPVIASYSRQDVGWTDGRVIYYNPYIASSLPAKVLAFFLAHEYGHIYQRTGDEIASDEFAARVYARTDMSVVYAAIWHMANIQPYSGDWTHPIGLQRAYFIGQAAGLSRPQIEAVMRGQF